MKSIDLGRYVEQHQITRIQQALTGQSGTFAKRRHMDVEVTTHNLHPVHGSTAIRVNARARMQQTTIVSLNDSTGAKILLLDVAGFGITGTVMG